MNLHTNLDLTDQQAKLSKKGCGWEGNSCERPTKVEGNGKLVGKFQQEDERMGRKQL